MIARSWEAVKSLHAYRLGNRKAAPYAEYVNDPVRFMREVRGFDPWQKQCEMAEALVTDRRVLSYTCNGAGKSTLLAELILWFMCTRINARVIVTAGVHAQVRALFRRLGGAHATSLRPLPGEPLTTQWNLGAEWFALGLSTEMEETMQGYHSWSSNPRETQKPGDDGGLLAIIDEASGCERWVFEAMRGYMTTDNCYWMVMGNPNRSNTAFHEQATRGIWKRFQISAFDVPEHIISRDWIAEQRQFWGEDSSQYHVRVLGQFPTTGADWDLVPLNLLEGQKDAEPNDGSGVHIGVDIARMGSDSTVMTLIDNGRVRGVQSWRKHDLMETASRVWRQTLKWEEQLRKERGRESLTIPAGNVHVEMDGIGSGVADRLVEAGYRVDMVHMGGAPSGAYRDLVGSAMTFRNRRAELHWVCRRLLESGRLAVPEKFGQTWRDLTQIRYDVDDRGTFFIESKEKLRSREGRSPDYSDSLIIALARNKRPVIRAGRLSSYGARS